MPVDADFPRHAAHTSATHRFRYSRWVARRTAALTLVVLYGTLVAVIFGRHDGVIGLAEAMIVAACAGIAALYMVIARHPVTRLTVGPEGIASPLGLMRRIAWHQIEGARYAQRAPVFWYGQEWLHLDLKPGTSGLLRLPLPEGIEARLLERTGISIPLHRLRDPSGVVLGSVERFMPVAHDTPEPERRRSALHY